MPTAPGDHYQTLGVSRNATQAEIRSAYLQAIKKVHPDANRDSPQTGKFNQAHEDSVKLTEAYDVLRNSEKRQAYDAMLKNDRQQERAQRHRQQQNSGRSNAKTSEQASHQRNSQQDRQQERQQRTGKQEGPRAGANARGRAETTRTYTQRQMPRRNFSAFSDLKFGYDEFMESWQARFRFHPTGIGDNFIFFTDNTRDYVSKLLKSCALISKQGAVNPDLVQEFVDAAEFGYLKNYFLADDKGKTVTNLQQFPLEYRINMLKSLEASPDKKTYRRTQAVLKKSIEQTRKHNLSAYHQRARSYTCG